MKSVVLLAASTALLAGASVASDPVAVLGDIQGIVLANQGEQFVSAEPGLALKAGDRVLVMVGGETSLTFIDGCALPLAGGSLTTVPEASVCAGAVVQTERVGPMFAQAVGAPNTQAAGASSKNTGGWASQQPRILWYGLGAVALGVGIAIAVDDDDDDRPISQ